MNPTDYCSYELSEALIDAGFNYRSDSVYYKADKSLNDYEIANIYLWEPEEYIEAPTLWQAQKWLREEKDWHIIVKPLLWGELTYEFKLWNKFNGYSDAIGFNFSSYEKALSKAIETVLKLIE